MQDKQQIDFTQADIDANTLPDHTLQDIDFSMVETPGYSPSEAEWEAPKHVYFGKKLPSGKMAAEPVYTYQEYPRMLYGLIEGRIRARVVNNDADKNKLLNSGFKLGPGDFGLETCPAKEVVNARAIVAEKREAVIETETVQIVKRGRGRPLGSKNKA